MKRKKIIIIALSVVFSLGILGGGLYAMLGTRIIYPVFSVYEGNSSQYKVKNLEKNPIAELENKTVVFLGSSVTDGYGSCGESFVDFLEAKHGIIAVKEAVSGTTLVDKGKDSYIPRMKELSKDIEADAFVCQLSTNDAKNNMPLGEVSTGFSEADFDTSTIAGSIEYIIYYVRETYNCPMAFYTSSKYDSENYENMVKLLYEIQEKWNIIVIDMWNDENFNNITEENRKLYMIDDVHPTRAGYGEWWLPKFEESLKEMV